MTAVQAGTGGAAARASLAGGGGVDGGPQADHGVDVEVVLAGAGAERDFVRQQAVADVERILALADHCAVDGGVAALVAGVGDGERVDVAANRQLPVTGLQIDGVGGIGAQQGYGRDGQRQLLELSHCFLLRE